MWTKLGNKNEYFDTLNDGFIDTKIKIGGDTILSGGKFKPEIYFEKWNGECWLKILSPVLSESKTEGIIGDKIVLSDGDWNYEYYIKNSLFENEIVIINPDSDEVLNPLYGDYLMATFTQGSNLCGEATVDFTYDDTTMKMTGVKLVNNSDKYLDIFMISPLQYNRRINPSESFNLTFTAIQRPSYQITDVQKTWGIAKTIGGIEWRCCLGV
jgi:hypothetical protein